MTQLVDIIIAVCTFGLAIAGFVRWRQTRAPSSLGSMLIGLSLASNMTSIVIRNPKDPHSLTESTIRVGLALTILSFAFLAASLYYTWGPPSRRGGSQSSPR